MRPITWFVALLLVVLGLAGCNGKESNGKNLPAARPLLQEAANKVQNADFFKMEISVTGYPVPINASGLNLEEVGSMTFQNARGAYAAPDKLQAAAQFNVGDAGITANIVAIGEQQFIQIDLLGNNWFQEQIVPGFSPMALMAAEGGIASALKAISGVKMVGTEDMDGLEVYHLQGKLPASQVNALTFGLLSTTTGDIAVDVFVSTEERQIEQVLLHEPLPEGVEDQEPTTWTITIYDYNEPVEITAPVQENTSTSYDPVTTSGAL